MSARGPSSPELISNPLIKKRNLEWSLDAPVSSRFLNKPQSEPKSLDGGPSTAAIEDGSETHHDPLEIFSKTLSAHIQPSQQTLPVSTYRALYTSNAGSRHGAHFVIHQHDHPVAGTHYDLRLQCNENSSVSWAVMYGLPGDGNSVRLNRNATETRVHCLWNHLIETASKHTGSLLIWDTGTYAVLPRRSKHAPREDPDSQPSSLPEAETAKTQQQLLHEAFQNRKIRLQLHGTKLPEPYILNMRLTKSEDLAGRKRRPAKRRKMQQAPSRKAPVETSSDSSTPEDDDEDQAEADLVPKGQEADDAEKVSAMDKEIREMEDEEVRRRNAYTGAENTIGSVHQRKWYLSLDRDAVGYERGKGGKMVFRAVDATSNQEEDLDESKRGLRLSYPFYVKGVEGERSVVTGRRGADILRDEGVESYTGRKGWKPVLN